MNYFIDAPKMINKVRYWHVICLFVISSITILLLSTSTSFLYSYYEQLDSIVFQQIGKEWLNGVLPYRDIWDLKGPLIYLLNSIGFLLIGSRYGILIVQVVFFFTSLLLAFDYFREKTTALVSFVLVFVVCCSLSFVYEGGNMVEEFILPLLVCSFIMMNKWLNQVIRGNNYHKWQYAFVYGVALAFSFLTRLTNALPLCIGVSFIALFLICKHAWKNLFYNIAAFVGGFSILVIPFIAYFSLTETLDDYLSILDFGFRYFSTSTNLFDFKKLLIFNFPIFFILPVSLAKSTIEHRFFYFFFWFLVSVTSLYWILSSRGFNHYSIIFIPYLVVSLYEIMSFNLKLRYAAYIVLILFVVRGVKHDISYINKLENVKTANLVLNNVMNKIPVSDRQNTLIYGDIIYPYLSYELKPYKYFYLQEENAGISPIYKKEMLEYLNESNPKFIIIASDANAIKDFLQSYSLYYSDLNIEIYQHIDS